MKTRKMSIKSLDKVAKGAKETVVHTAKAIVAKWWIARVRWIY